jgi:hypothetical protein
MSGIGGRYGGGGRLLLLLLLLLLVVKETRRLWTVGGELLDWEAEGGLAIE